MGNKPLFSIIIPVYKIEKYIEECVKSILQQDFADFEIILIDDGSPDKCPMICDNLSKQDCRIKVYHKSNEGVAAARKDASEKANGEYIICIDGDDWIGDGCLSTIAKAVEETNADIVCHGMVYDNGEKLIPTELTYRFGYYTKKDIETEIFPLLIQKSDASYFIPSLCGKAIRRTLFKENLLANKLVTIGEDGACVIPCVFNAQSMYILKECFYFYRYNDQSATKGKKVFNWEWSKIVADHIVKKVDIHYGDLEEQLNRKIVHDVFSVVLTQFNRDEPYRVIVKDIKMHLNDKVYHDAICNSKFENSLKAKIMKCSLKWGIYLPIYFYSKL